MRSLVTPDAPITRAGFADIYASTGAGIPQSGNFIEWLETSWKKLSEGLSRYVLLSSVDTDGNPVSHLTTRRAGTVIVRDVGRGPERFELTNVRLRDGSFVAEPMDRYA
ncbi:hypothetical protein [Streptomyces sp. NPDC096132]|uniref:hypothetical protein n=1 Tax=Streptomyces sp. NPDC096132 TaxID=3366075 RepID=UPI00382979C9